ncbi:MAG: VOC family protein [Cyanobacteria bacterium P01_A01_bin.37]
MAQALFHLAFPVTDIAQTKAYYADGLGCEVGRENEKSVILNLYGHQLVAHLTPPPLAPQTGIYPRHFGLVFTDKQDWNSLHARAQAHQLSFYVQPKRRFEGSVLDHDTFFLSDPFQNLMEFKYYRHPEAVFGAKDEGMIGDA